MDLRNLATTRLAKRPYIHLHKQVRFLDENFLLHSPMAVRLGRNFPEDAQIVWEQALDLDTSRAPLNSQ